ncbi:MAG: type IX secretion system membrane protein PorP/SprF [Cyclobacteriaceae bacterium]
MQRRTIYISVLLVCLGAFGFPALAQQEVMFTQYMHNEVSINPGYAGSDQVGNITGLYRNQWSGMPGAPKTFSLNAHAPTGLQDGKVGLGLSLLNDQIGIYEQFRFFGVYSYRIELGDNKHLQLGLQAGVIHLQTGLTSLNPKNSNDVNFISDPVSSVNLNFGTGAYFFTDKFYAGLSVPQLMPHKAQHDGTAIFTQKQHVFLTSGYVFDLSSDLKLKPSVMLKYTQAAPVGVDVTGNLIIRDILWTGLNWRQGDSIDLLLGVQASKQIYVGYAYDYGLSELSDYHNGSHEIVLNYRLHFSSTRVLTPRFF